jgi:RimJ/RimL family protein N-acetyltransferase
MSTNPTLTTLETERLTLRPMVADDFDALLTIFTDPKVMASFKEPPFNRERMAGWLNRNLEHQQQYGYGLFSVCLKTNGVLIGDCGLEQMEVNGEVVAELGYDFRSDYWGQGYATEAASAVRDYAFGALHLPKLISLIWARNRASARVAEKVGLTLAVQYEKYGRSYWQYALKNPAFGEQA